MFHHKRENYFSNFLSYFLGFFFFIIIFVELMSSRVCVYVTFIHHPPNHQKRISLFVYMRVLYDGFILYGKPYNPFISHIYPFLRSLYYSEHTHSKNHIPKCESTFHIHTHTKWFLLYILLVDIYAKWMTTYIIYTRMLKRTYHQPHHFHINFSLISI